MLTLDDTHEELTFAFESLSQRPSDGIERRVFERDSICTQVRISLISAVFLTYSTVRPNLAYCKRGEGQGKNNEVKRKILKCAESKVKGTRTRHKWEEDL